MPTLVVPASVSPHQIDDFPSECARTKRGKAKIEGGSLYIRPASTLSVTDEELAHIKKSHPTLFTQLIVHKTGRPNVEVAKAKAAVGAKAEADFEEAARADAKAAAAAKAAEEASTKKKRSSSSR